PDPPTHAKAGAFGTCTCSALLLRSRGIIQSVDIPTERPTGRRCSSADREKTRRNQMAGGLGFEPRLAESESAVLPLDDPPSAEAAGRLQARKRPLRLLI